jgi:hypothetical protein
MDYKTVKDKPILFFEFKKFPAPKLGSPAVPCTVYLQKDSKTGMFDGYCEYSGNGKYKINSFHQSEMKSVLENYHKHAILRRKGYIDATGVKVIT